MAINPILRQARFAREVSRLLEHAAGEGEIAQADECLTSDEAGFVYQCCDDQWTEQEVAETLIDTRQAKYATDARRKYGAFGAVPMSQSDEQFIAAMQDAGRGRLVR